MNRIIFINVLAFFMLLLLGPDAVYSQRNGPTALARLAASIPVQRSSCSAPSVYNSFSNTCIRVVDEPMTWIDAYFHCQLSGEGLLVLDTIQSVNWFNHLRRTTNGWNSGWFWLGGRRFNQKWYWLGRKNAEMLQQDWEDPQPDESGDCLQIFDKGRQWKWDDYSCDVKQKFVCEKTL